MHDYTISNITFAKMCPFKKYTIDFGQIIFIVFSTDQWCDSLFLSGFPVFI